ncbi:M23 family peptidase [Paenibacillus albiflavus]|uniref:M23 family peptidase n=1 Tax=Paenibacillus albiflavus TaxID=2545760 RepID=A0A4R4E967_9BACL|nr:M23 family metallopeptidase [Paenibacillus albiflavus]TCZ76374.1 M23 family peptidase [Paenibacillus albiflavus]
MKFIWGKKEFTLMIIRGANRRVIRLKLPQSTFIIIPTIVSLVLIGFLLTVYFMDLNLQETTESLQQVNTEQEQSYSKQIATQNSEMQKLQDQLLEFSDQTDQFKQKLAEIQKLEHVISIMTDNSASNSNNSITPNSENHPQVSQDVGGVEEPVTADEWIALIGNTKTDLSDLISNIEGLLTSLTASEQKLVEAEALREITPTIWPSDSRRKNSGFGIRKDPFTSKASMHTGLDIDGEIGDNVYATAGGKVIETGTHHDYGNYILIEHSKGVQTKYMHLSKILVKKGDKVSKGNLIGLVGSTGRSTGPHLHYEVILNGKRVNPEPYLLSSRKDD